MDQTLPLLTSEQFITVFNQTKTATAFHVGDLAVIEAANEAMLKLWGKDRSVIGKPLEVALPELKGQPFAEMFKKVWQDGETVSGNETAAELIVDGEKLIFYFDFEYKAIKDRTGKTICVLHTAVNVTDRVLNREIMMQAAAQEQAFLREQSLNEELAASNEELNAVNEELSQNQEELRTLNETLEKRVERRVQELSDSEARYRILSNELSAINEEMTASNEELLTSNEELYEAQERLKQAFFDLEDKEIALRLAIEAANFGTWHIHSVTRELITSVRLRELFGFYPEEEITVQDALGQVTEEHREHVAEKLENAILGNGDFDISYAVIGFHDGNLRWLRAIGNLKADKSGEFSDFTGVVMDISVLKKDEQRKNDFIGMVSHELKTPLTSLSGYLQLLQRKTMSIDDSFIKDSLSMAARQVKKMTTMINGFLNISRLESGKIVLNQQHFLLDELIQDAVHESRLMDAAYHIHFEPTARIPVYADADKINNVISNLLSNAVKYASDHKDIVVKCEMINGKAQVSVKDQGIGISDHDADRIFERYYRVGRDSHVSGFGIGLYLSAEIIARHQGEIWLESEIGTGSTFYFNLPIAAESALPHSS